MKKKILFVLGVFANFMFAQEINTGNPLRLINPAHQGITVYPGSPTNNNDNIMVNGNSNTIKKSNDDNKISVLNNDNMITNKSSAKLIGRLTVTKTKPEKILEIRKRMNNVQKSLVSPLVNPVGINKTVKFKKGEEISVNIKAGFTTVVNFVDDAGNPVKFTYLTIGNNFVKVTQFGNKLEIKALRTYSVTNLIVGIEGYDYPVTLNLREVGDNGDKFDNYINVILTGAFQEKVGSDDIRLKSAILQYVFKYGKVDGLPRMDYEVYSLKTKKSILFSKNVLKIYKVEKFGKTYYLILLNKNFAMYGNKTFGTYSSKYNIYFLNFNQNVFTIRTNPSLKTPVPMVERYRIIIKDF